MLVMRFAKSTYKEIKTERIRMQAVLYKNIIFINIFKNIFYLNNILYIV